MIICFPTRGNWAGNNSSQESILHFELVFQRWELSCSEFMWMGVNSWEIASEVIARLNLKSLCLCLRCKCWSKKVEGFWWSNLLISPKILILPSLWYVKFCKISYCKAIVMETLIKVKLEVSSDNFPTWLHENVKYFTFLRTSDGLCSSVPQYFSVNFWVSSSLV